MLFKIKKILLFLLYQFLFFKSIYCLRNSLFGSNIYGTAAKLLSETQSSLRKNEASKGDDASLVQGDNKVTLEAINNDVKNILQKEASNAGFGTCLFTNNPYIDMGLRDTNYTKCTQFLLSMETWMDDVVINKEMVELMSKLNLSIPSLLKFKVPALEVVFKETFVQICVNFFVTAVNNGQLFLNNNVCTGVVCHEQLNSVCNTLTEKYGKSSLVLGSTCVADTVKRVCQESRRQLAAKYPTLIASPADIRLNNKPIEVQEPVPT